MSGADRWWHAATGYQIYPRSFCDSDGDGIGDIPGIVSKLDHLADLGVGFVWLSPVYASPMVDMGYDIADYRAVAPEFGTLADLDRLIAEAGARGIRIVMDLVVNHTSDRHAWFQAARASREAPHHAFYIWRDPGPDGGPPDDQRAIFGGPAWHWVPEVGRYYYGHFSAEQPDLNWQNGRVRAEVYDMMRWWADRGIGGFRMDVIDLIGKDVDARIYEEGPDLHPFLQEMHREVLAGRDLLTVGESWAVSPETAPLYCGRDRGELDMVFQFQHVTAGWDPRLGKWAPRPVDLPALKRVIGTWQAALADDGWNALFLSNHDLPRQVSRYGDPAFRVASAKALATVLHLLKGTPFVFQGEEIGMVNAGFAAVENYRDLETLRHYAERVPGEMTAEQFLAAAAASSRDNARTPMPWTDAEGAGFTDGVPWIPLAQNWREVNVAADRADPDGVFQHYRHLIALRRQSDLIRHGDFLLLEEGHPALFAYWRRHGGAAVLVAANLSSADLDWDLPTVPPDAGWLVSTHGRSGAIPPRLTFAPWEAVAVGPSPTEAG